MATTQRISVPVANEEAALVEAARTPGTPEYEALRAIAAIGDPADLSQARTLGLLLKLGAQAVAERVQEAGYAAYAASLTDEDRDTQRAMAEQGLQLTGAID